MTLRAIFEAYASERKSLVPPGYRLDCLDRLVRLTPLALDLEGVVMFSELPEALIDDAINTQSDYFQTLGRPFEWKVYTFDTPSDLPQRLKARGFTSGDSEAFMVYPVNTPKKTCPARSFRIERINTEAGIDHVVSIQQEVWGRSFPWLKHSLCTGLERTAIFCAYAENVPVGTGWIEFPEHSSFAEIHGGAVLPGQRGRGIYSALFQARVLEAQSRRFQFIAVDAAPLSRPILLQKGFIYVCDTIPFHKSAL